MVPFWSSHVPLPFNSFVKRFPIFALTLDEGKNQLLVVPREYQAIKGVVVPLNVPNTLHLESY